MTTAVASRQGLTALSSPIVAGVLLVAALGAAVPAAAQQQAPAQQAVAVAASSMGELEKTFWYCDHAATTVGVDTATGAMCVSATEDLKATKFNGDFNALLSWWREHKIVQHQMLDIAARRASR